MRKGLGAHSKNCFNYIIHYCHNYQKLWLESIFFSGIRCRNQIRRGHGSMNKANDGLSEQPALVYPPRRNKEMAHRSGIRPPVARTEIEIYLGPF
jgi:hypothetical protein